MPTNYVRYARSQPMTVFYDEPEPEALQVLVFDPVLEEHGPETLGDRFRKIDIAFRDADVVFFRGSTTWSVQHNGDLRALVTGDRIVRELTKSAHIGILYVATAPPAGPRLQLELVRSLPSQDLPDIDWMSLLRRVEILAFARKTDAVSQGHFALPSGIHTDTYVSLRRLLHDPTNVVRLADWFVHDLRSVDGILTDQAPMLSLAYALQALAARMHGLYPSIKVLDEYPADHKTVADALHALGEEAGEPRRLLFLLSVTHTGRLLRYYQSAAIDTSVLRVIFATKTDGPQIPGIVPLLSISSGEYTLSPDGTCELCRRGLPLSRINPRTFEPENAMAYRPLKATVEYLQRHARFWGIADEADAVRLHYDDAYHHRHHAVYLEIPKLLAHTEFRRESLKKLRELRIVQKFGLRPDLVLIPHHSTSEYVRDLIRQAFPDATVEILPGGSMRIPPEMGPRIATSTYLVVADDAVVTTKTMTALKLQIYNLCRAYGKAPHVDFFAVVARPPSSQHLVWLSNRVYDNIGPHLHFAYHVNLPHPGAAACPLCDERGILERYIPQLSAQAKKYAQRRLRSLRGTIAAPLYETTAERVVNSLLVWNEQGQPINALRRTVFAATQAASLLLQDEVETRERKAEIWRVDVSDIISKYYDAEILGGFFRSISRRFLSWPSNPAEIAAQLSDFPVGETAKEVLAEMGWAAVLGRLPAGPVLDHLRGLNDDPHILMMRELIELNTLP